MAKQLGLVPRNKPRSRERRVKATPGRLFEALCVAAGLREPVPEFCFAPPRKWRFDWAWPEAKVAIEQQGGIFSGGRHVRGPALVREYEKLNAAACLGWRILFVLPEQMNDGSVIGLLCKAIEGA